VRFDDVEGDVSTPSAGVPSTAAAFAAPFAAPARAALLVVVVFAAFDAFGATVASVAFAASVTFVTARSSAGSPLADTPVPVPSGASSSCAERETEVTQTTYQDPSPTLRLYPGFLETEAFLSVASRSHYENATPSWFDAVARYPDGRHNGVSKCELPDERRGNVR
jgi:hypothetical protein